MTSHSVLHKTATALCVSLLALASGAYAQANNPSSQPSAPNQSANRAARIAVLEQRYQIQIVLDPELETPEQITFPEKSVSLTTALNQLMRQIPNAAWQSISLRRDVPLPEPEKLAATVRAINHLPFTELLVENLPQHHATLLLSRARLSQESAVTDVSDTKPIYVFFDTSRSSDGKSALERVTDLQGQQLTLMAQLTPNQRPNPILMGQQVMQRLSKTGSDAPFRALLQAGTTVWQNTPSDAREELMQQFLSTVQSHTSPPSALGAPQEAVPDTPLTTPQNQIRALQDRGEALAKRYHVRILIEPTLYVPASPTLPTENLTLEQALNSLSKSVPGSAWRNVYQKPPTVSSASLSARDLAAIVRTLENLPTLPLRLENPVSERRLTLQSDFGAASLSAVVTAHSLEAHPTFLLYSLQDETEKALPVRQRLEEIQRQQMELLLGLNAGQMTQVMADTLTQYAHQTGDAQSQIIHLPIMALLMGTWFPQKARESKAH